MSREILPNITQPIIVEGTIRLGYAVFTAATLSFLGFGLVPPSPDWGLTIATERIFLQIAPWTVMFPAAALASLVVGVNLITDGLGRTFSK
jgi:peptide/nickel transport system permease protein